MGAISATTERDADLIIANKDIGDFDEFYADKKSVITYEYGAPNFSCEDLRVVFRNKIHNRVLLERFSFDVAKQVYEEIHQGLI